MGASAMLVTTEPELRYFTGFHTPFWQSPTRPWFLLIPVEQKPVAVIPSIGQSLMERTWVSDIRTWSSPRPHDDGVTLLADTIGEFVGEGETLAVPMGPETHLRMPLRDWDSLIERIGNRPVADATPIIQKLRMRKSEDEIAKVRHICGIASAAFERIPEILSAGMTEREMFRAFQIELLQQGADQVPYLVGATGRDFVDVIRQPTDRVVEEGDLLMFDTGSVWDGYYCDFDRNFAFGQADDEAKRAYHTVWEATEAGLAAARPEATTTQVWEAMAGVLMAGGSRGNDVGRLGHGLGMQLTEWPSNTADDNTVIKEGMILTLEPGMTWAPGKMMLHEENVVIRADGPELLSRRAAPELPIL